GTDIVREPGAIFKRDGGPVAVTKQDRSIKAKFADQAMQIDIGFGVVEIDGTGDIARTVRIGFSVTAPFIDNHWMAGCGGEPCREIAPHAAGPECLVKEH